MMPPVEIKLRAKYRSVLHGRFKAVGDHNGKTTRRKIGYEKHVALYGVPPRRVMLMGPTGKTVMVTREA